MNTMTYRGYAARIEYSDEDQCLIGHIAGINDVVGFHGDSVAELRTAFEEAVEDYLEACEKLGRAPQKPYSGKLMLPRATRSSCGGGGGGASQREKHQSVGGRGIHQGCADIVAHPTWGWAARFAVMGSGSRLVVGRPGRGLTPRPPSMLALLSNPGWEAQRVERPWQGRLAEHTGCDKSESTNPTGGPCGSLRFRSQDNPSRTGWRRPWRRTRSVPNSLLSVLIAGLTGSDTWYCVRPGTTVSW